MSKITFYIFAILLFYAACQSKKTNANTQAGQSSSLLAVEEFSKQCLGQSAHLVDVRTPSEWAEGTLPAALNIDYNNPNFEPELQKLDKTKTLCIFCQVGGRSAKAHKIALNLGFKQVIELDGGYKAWKNAKK